MWVLGLLISASCTLQDCQILVGTILPHPAPDGGSGCEDGNHLCGDSCVANDVSACGDACTPCVASAHGTTSCDGTKCVAACDDGYLAEGDHCKIKFTQISAGGIYACGVTSAGGVKCWGHRNYQTSQVPIDVAGLDSGIESVSVSPFHHQCAVMTDGKVKCWGLNVVGQLGSIQDPSVSYQEDPVEVPGIVNAQRVTTGNAHSCALLSDGSVSCWGSYDVYSTHQNSGFSQPSWGYSQPPADAGLSNVISMSTDGQNKTYVLLASGAIKCLIGGEGGHLTAVDVPDAYFPGAVQVNTLDPFLCVVLNDGSVKCTATSLPDYHYFLRDARFDLFSNVAALDLEEMNACATTKSGGVTCVGTGRYLGNGSDVGSNQPVGVSDLSGVVSITSGTEFHCALLDTGEVKCWGLNGLNGEGTLGVGRGTWAWAPVEVALEGNVTSVTTGSRHACALLSTGAVKCWGDPTVGQLGNGQIRQQPYERYYTGSRAVDVAGLSSGVTAIAAGATHTCALLENGGVKCWGALDERYPTSANASPVDVIGVSNAVALFSFLNESCAVVQDGTAKCWGWIPSIYAWSATAVEIPELSGATGMSDDCAILPSGSIRCWDFSFRQNAPPMITATDVTSLGPGVLSIGGWGNLNVGDGHYCALVSNGAVKCWGFGWEGELGRGPTSLVDPNPGDVVGINMGATSLSVTRYHACAVTSQGGVKCWGNAGTLGIGVSSAIAPSMIAWSTVPIDVTGIGGATMVSVGFDDASIGFSCAVAQGKVKCWGGNGYGQLGVEPLFESLVPIEVTGY